MSYYAELEQDLIAMRNKTDLNIDELITLAALQERARLFEKLIWLIQQKDSINDTVAVAVLAWAWQELSE